MHAPSYYAATANDAPRRPPLDADVVADVCVVGAGYSGLSTALHLAEAGFDVIVLEQKAVGWGASGRNGGQIVNGYSRDLDVIARRYGGDAARALGAMALEGGDVIRERIERYAIDCDLVHNNIFAAVNARQMRGLEHELRTWAEHGHTELDLLDASDMRREIATRAYVGGLRDRRGGHLHPLNLALGEAAAIEQNGGRIHERSAVQSVVRSGAGVRVTTESGAVNARFAVLAGNAHLSGVRPDLEGRVMPVGTHIIATEPLGAERARSLLPENAAIEDANYVLDYFRRTADHRLLFGGGIHYGGGTSGDIRDALLPRMCNVFPQLTGVGIDFAWSGNFALTLTRVPQLGRLDDVIYFAHGYSGHGVTTSHLAGRLLAEAIRGDAERFDVFAGLPVIPFPGGRALRVPLTRLGAWWYSLRDRLGV